MTAKTMAGKMTIKITETNKTATITGKNMTTMIKAKAKSNND
jgi:hypothetical protein